MGLEGGKEGDVVVNYEQAMRWRGEEACIKQDPPDEDPLSLQVDIVDAELV